MLSSVATRRRRTIATGNPFPCAPVVCQSCPRMPSTLRPLPVPRESALRGGVRGTGRARACATAHRGDHPAMRSPSLSLSTLLEAGTCTASRSPRPSPSSSPQHRSCPAADGGPCTGGPCDGAHLNGCPCKDAFPLLYRYPPIEAGRGGSSSPADSSTWRRFRLPASGGGPRIVAIYNWCQAPNRRFHAPPTFNFRHPSDTSLPLCCNGPETVRAMPGGRRRARGGGTGGARAWRVPRRTLRPGAGSSCRVHGNRVHCTLPSWG